MLISIPHNVQALPIINFSSLQFTKTIILTLFIFSTLHSWGQKTDTTRLLELIQAKNYREINACWGDSIITFRQTLIYQDSTVLEDHSTQLLTVRFLHATELKDNKLFDVDNDRTLIRCSYERISLWNQSKNETTISGQVRVIAIKEKTIELEFDLTVVEPKTGIHLYKGIRKFTRTKLLVDIPVNNIRQQIPGRQRS